MNGLGRTDMTSLPAGAKLQNVRTGERYILTAPCRARMGVSRGTTVFRPNDGRDTFLWVQWGIEAANIAWATAPGIAF